MYKLEFLKDIFGKVEKLAGGIWSEYKMMLSHSLTTNSFKKFFLYVEYNLH